MSTAASAASFPRAIARRAAPAAAAGSLPRWLSRGAWTMLVLCSVLFFALPFAGTADGRPDLAVYADDFFYYLVVAERVVAGEGFTFDGVTQTNGFHPLWMAVLVAIGAIAPPRGTVFFPILHAVLLVAALATMTGCHRMLRETFGYSEAAALVATLAVSINVVYLARYAMETTLALPLMFYAIVAMGRLVDVPGFGRALAAALLAAAAILARLDSAILFALLGLAGTLQAWRGGRLAALLAPQTLAGIALGALPLLAYVMVNILLFDSWQPISGRAKQLADGVFFNGSHFVWFALGIYHVLNLHVWEPAFFVLGVPAVLAIVMAGLSLFRRAIPSAHAPMAWVVVGFPVLYYAVLGVISDWVIWVWYLYPLVPAGAVAGAGIVQWLSERAGDALRRTLLLMLPAGVGIAAGATMVYQARHVPEVGHVIVDAGRALAAFAAANPGRYAMGDRAGAFAFLTDRQVVQLEGLVGDDALLAAIGARRSLLEELAARGIDYYVGTRMPRVDDCWLAEEPRPMQSGERSPSMASFLCEPPVLRHVDPTNVETLVFRLRPPQPHPRAAPVR